MSGNMQLKVETAYDRLVTGGSSPALAWPPGLTRVNSPRTRPRTRHQWTATRFWPPEALLLPLEDPSRLGKVEALTDDARATIEALTRSTADHDAVWAAGSPATLHSFAVLRPMSVTSPTRSEDLLRILLLSSMMAPTIKYGDPVSSLVDALEEQHMDPSCIQHVESGKVCPRLAIAAKRLQLVPDDEEEMRVSPECSPSTMKGCAANEPSSGPQAGFPSFFPVPPPSPWARPEEGKWKECKQQYE